jgi:hypothetical protein
MGFTATAFVKNIFSGFKNRQAIRLKAPQTLL